MLNVFDDYQDRQQYATEREQRLTPGKDVLRLYRQLKPWKVFMTLTHKEIRTLRLALASHYPQIERQSKDYVWAARWGFVKGFAVLAVLVGLAIMIGGIVL